MSDGKNIPTGPGNIKISIDDDIAQGMYSNFQVAGSNETEFVLDFAYVQPHQMRGKVRARIILSPKHAKALSHILGERLRDFESRYGTITAPTPSQADDTGLPN